MKMNKEILLLILTVAVLFILDYITGSYTSSQFSENWQSEIADNTGWVGIDSYLAIDSGNNPHISHYDQANRDLRYAYHDGITWHREVVDSEDDIGEASGIAIDDSGRPHIS